MSTLTVNLFYGLANRLMALVSAVRVAKLTGYRLQVIWHKDQSCKALLSDLFETDFDIIGYDEYWRMNQSNKVTILDSQDTRDYIPEYIDRNNLNFFRYDGILVMPRSLFLKGNIILQAHHFFFVEDDIDKLSNDRRLMAALLSGEFASFRPLPILRDLADSYAQRLENGIGLHIRRPFPHAWTEDGIEIERFLWSFPSVDIYMDLLPKLRELTGFNGNLYLSTNCAATKSEVIARLGESNVLTHQTRTLDPSYSVVSVQDALVDMMALSKTSLIMRFSESTFAYFSAMLGGCNQAIIYRDSPTLVKGPLEFC
ncbi:hypothetical protein ABNQ39_06485 [Azospirillum sp. A26]|uniref:hypothetical protein n=1 Tax=Azospirillum sp. A26 TaxID=3160607 RepID=UPI00366B716C